MVKKKESSFRGKVGSDSKRQKQSSGGSARYLSLPSGISQFVMEDTVKKIQLDIIPYEVSDKNHPDRDTQYNVAVPGELWYKRPIKVHQNVGPKNERCLCLQSIGKKCPICEFQKELFDKGEKDEAIALYPKSRVLYVVVPRGSKKHEEEPFIWDMAQSLFQDVLNEAIQEDEDNEIFPDLEEGKTLELSIKWKTIGDSKPYPEVRHIEFLDRDEEIDSDILDKVPNLDECLNVLSYEDLERKFMAIEDDEDEDDKPAKKSSKEDTTKKKPTKKVEEDEDEDNEKPVKKVASKPAAKKPVKEEEEDDLSWNELEAMSALKLKKLLKSNEALEDIDIDDYDLEDEDSVTILKTDIAEALDIEIPKKKSAKKVVEEDEDEDEKSVKKSTSKPAAKSKTKLDNECPEGFVYGKDHGRKEECDDCPLYDECLDAKNAMKKK
jgi:hypothetical protein